MAYRGIATAALVLAVAACGDEDTAITTQSQLIGAWNHSDGGTMPAERITFAKDAMTGEFFATVRLSATRFTGATYEVTPDGLILVFPSDPANTTWCAPAASLTEGKLCFDDFDAVCEAIPGRPGVASPLSGCFAEE